MAKSICTSEHYTHMWLFNIFQDFETRLQGVAPIHPKEYHWCQALMSGNRTWLTAGGPTHPRCPQGVWWGWGEQASAQASQNSPPNSDSHFFRDLPLTTGGIATLKQQRPSTNLNFISFLSFAVVMIEENCYCTITVAELMCEWSLFHTCPISSHCFLDVYCNIMQYSGCTFHTSRYIHPSIHPLSTVHRLSLEGHGGLEPSYIHNPT